MSLYLYTVFNFLIFTQRKTETYTRCVELQPDQISPLKKNLPDKVVFSNVFLVLHSTCACSFIAK